MLPSPTVRVSRTRDVPQVGASLRSDGAPALALAMEEEEPICFFGVPEPEPDINFFAQPKPEDRPPRCPVQETLILPGSLSEPAAPQVVQQPASRPAPRPVVADDALSQALALLRLSPAPDQPPLSTLGLVNTGNACFRNVVLQALLSLPEFVELLRLLRDGSLLDVAASEYWREMLALYELFRPPEIGAVSPLPSVTAPDDSLPGTFRGFRTQRRESFEGNPSQEDAMEFLTFLLDALHEELLSLSQGKLAAAQEQLSGGAMQDDGWSAVPSRQKGKAVVDASGQQEALRSVFASPISAVFHGVFRSEVHYTQRRVTSVTFQRFHCLSLDLPPSERGRKQRSSVPLETALAAFFKEEELPAQKLRKTLLLEHLPRILVLQLKRFAFDTFYGTTTKVGS